MIEVPGQQGVTECVITADAVNGTASPTLIKGHPKRKRAEAQPAPAPAPAPEASLEGPF